MWHPASGEIAGYRQSMAETDTVVHDEAGSRFVLMRGEREIGFTNYATREDGGIVFMHTEVDTTLQEGGLGSKLIRGALDEVRASTSVPIGATCPFVGQFLAKHPEFEDLTER
jgi:predicted GNAT family acetyltransferase